MLIKLQKFQKNHSKIIQKQLKLKLCDYSDAYILLSETITLAGGADNDATKQEDERNKEVIFKNFGPFTNYINEINNTQIDNAKDIDANA